MPAKAIIATLCISMALSGCLARTAIDIVTAPVKIVSKGVDLATTSQYETDEKRGRALRQRDQRIGELDRLKEKKQKKCAKGKKDACAEISIIDDEINRLLREPY